MFSIAARNDQSMFSENEPTRDRIFRLLRLAIGSDISHDDFRSLFERLYNLELERDEVSAVEFEALQELFDRIVWYSPFPEDRQSISNYIDEAEVDAAVTRARAKLGITS